MKRAIPDTSQALRPYQFDFMLREPDLLIFKRFPKKTRDVKSTHASTHGKWLPSLYGTYPDRILGCLASATFASWIAIVLRAEADAKAVSLETPVSVRQCVSASVRQFRSFFLFIPTYRPRLGCPSARATNWYGLTMNDIAIVTTVLLPNLLWTTCIAIISLPATGPTDTQPTRSPLLARIRLSGACHGLVPVSRSKREIVWTHSAN